MFRKHRMKVSDKGVLSTLLWPKMNEVTWDGGNCIMKKFMMCKPHHTLFRDIQ